MDNSPSSSNNKQQEETGFSHLQSLLLITYADGFASQATFSRLLDRCFLYRTKVQLGLILPRGTTNKYCTPSTALVNLTAPSGVPNTNFSHGIVDQNCILCKRKQLWCTTRAKVPPLNRPGYKASVLSLGICVRGKTYHWETHITVTPAIFFRLGTKLVFGDVNLFYHQGTQVFCHCQLTRYDVSVFLCDQFHIRLCVIVEPEGTASIWVNAVG